MLKKEEDARLAIEQGKNLIIRQDIISKINDLSQVSDNIGAAIKKLVELQGQWKATGAVSPHKYKENQAEYSKAIEEFNYKLSLSKQLQEHDLKRNYELKTELLEKIKVHTNAGMTLADIKADYLATGLEDFDLFWDNKPINSLHKVGLLRI
jgi:hypothetical protein